jgi:hypothetical protein
LCPGVLFVGPVSRCPGVTNCVLKYCLPVSRCPGVLFVGPLVHANQTSRFRRLLRGSAEGLVWLGGGSLLGELPHPRRLLAAAPAADVEVLPRCLHACPWGTGRERGGWGKGRGGGGRGEGSGGSDSHGSWVPGPGLEWLGMILLWIHSFIHSCIHSFIYAFVHSYSQPSGTRTGTPEVSNRVTSRETSRDTSRGTGVTGGHQPGPETPAGTPDSFPPTLHNFGHRKWFPKSSGRGRGVGDDL